MNMYAMGVAANAAAMANTAGAVTQTDQSAETSGISFSELLSSVTGMDISNLSWRDIQNGMMLQAMGEMKDTPVVTDPVLAQLLQMMKQLSGDGDVNGGNVVDMLGLIEQMQKRLQEMAEENGGQMAGQEMLALMGNLIPQMTGMPMDTATYQALSADGGEALLKTVLDSQPGDVMRMLVSMPAQYTTDTADAPTNVDSLMAQLLGGNTATADTPGTISTADILGTTSSTAATQTVLSADSNVADILMAMNESEGTGAASMALANVGVASQAEGQSTFEAAVHQAKQQMAAGTGIAGTKTAETGIPQTTEAAPQAEKPTLDVDSLQQHVNAGTYLQNTALAPTVTQVPAQEAPQPTLPPALQLAENLQRAVADGETQLTVKLTPESLGEVTIQLTQTTEGLHLSIIAKNAETQNLLASQIDSLKDAMRPMNVEVESILTEQQYNQMNEQQFGGQHQRQWTEMHGAAYYGDEPLAGDDDAILASVMQQAVPASALDTYI